MLCNCNKDLLMGAYRDTYILGKQNNLNTDKYSDKTPKTMCNS